MSLKPCNHLTHLTKVLTSSRNVNECMPLVVGKAMNRIKSMAAASAFSRWAEMRADARKARHVMSKIVLYRAGASTRPLLA
jgi:hypothetical protein